MKGYCTKCGRPLDDNGNCEIKCRQAPKITSTSELPVVGQPKAAIGPFPKPSTGRRLLGSGVEFLTYWIAIVVLNIVSPFTAGVLGLIGVPLLLAVVALRDVNAGAMSVGKRVSGMRVVDHRTGQPATNNQAIARNSYYILLIVLMIVPYTKSAPSGLFVALILLDLMMIIASRDGRRMGDLLARTQVVSEAHR